MRKLSKNRVPGINIEGVKYSAEAILTLSPEAWGEGNRKAALLFLKEWYNDSPTIELKSSGSTGSPKVFRASKEAMIQSASNSCRFFGLEKGMSTLIALSMEYIASKMMLVRAIIAEMNVYVVEPGSRPFQDFDKAIDFVPLVPMQVLKSLENSPDRERLFAVTTVLIGGTSIEQNLETAIVNLPNRFFSSYGMTETLSHIAIRRLNGEKRSSHYFPLENYKISVSEKGTLIVQLPWQKEALCTNDRIELESDGSFSILGRCDNVVNSGGVKIQIEEIERKIEVLLKGRYAISSIPDSVLGEKLVLVSEESIDMERFRELTNGILSKYESPTLVIQMKIPLTESGKINRFVLKESLEKRVSTQG